MNGGLLFLDFYRVFFLLAFLTSSSGKYIHIPKGLERISISISISHAATVLLLLVTSFSSSFSSSSSSSTLPLSSSEYKHLVSCSCLGKRTNKMTGWIEVRVVV